MVYQETSPEYKAKRSKVLKQYSANLKRENAIREEQKKKRKKKSSWANKKVRNAGVGKSLNKYLIGKRMTVKLGG